MSKAIVPKKKYPCVKCGSYNFLITSGEYVECSKCGTRQIVTGKYDFKDKVRYFTRDGQFE